MNIAGGGLFYSVEMELPSLRPHKRLPSMRQTSSRRTLIGRSPPQLSLRQVAVASDLYERSIAAGQFTPARISGREAWWDDGRPMDLTRDSPG
jgi:hypothetical protein